MLSKRVRGEDARIRLLGYVRRLRLIRPLLSRQGGIVQSSRGTSMIFSDRDLSLDEINQWLVVIVTKEMLLERHGCILCGIRYQVRTISFMTSDSKKVFSQVAHISLPTYQPAGIGQSHLLGLISLNRFHEGSSPSDSSLSQKITSDSRRKAVYSFPLSAQYLQDSFAFPSSCFWAATAALAN